MEALLLVGRFTGAVVRVVVLWVGAERSGRAFGLAAGPFGWCGTIRAGLSNNVSFQSCAAAQHSRTLRQGRESRAAYAEGWCLHANGCYEKC